MIATRQREKFDINNALHLQYVRDFITNNKWGPNGCPFELERPWLSVPTMISDRLVAKFLGLTYTQGENKFTLTYTKEATSSM